MPIPKYIQFRNLAEPPAASGKPPACVTNGSTRLRRRTSIMAWRRQQFDERIPIDIGRIWTLNRPAGARMVIRNCRVYDENGKLRNRLLANREKTGGKSMKPQSSINIPIFLTMVIPDGQPFYDRTSSIARYAKQFFRLLLQFILYIQFLVL